MQVTLYKPGNDPVGLVGFLNVRRREQMLADAELDADRDQVAQQLGCERADVVFADSHSVIFGATSVTGLDENPAASKAADYLLKVRGKPFSFGTLKGPILIVQEHDRAREVVQLVVDNTHLDTFTSFLDQYHAQEEEALDEAAEEHYQDWLATAEPGDNYVVSENDHSLDPIEPGFEVIQSEVGMFSQVYDLIFPSTHAAMHFGLKWGQQLVQLATPGALANLTEEEQQALMAARMQPNSLQAMVELRKLATQGFWQPSEQGIIASVTYHEEPTNEESDSLRSRSTAVSFTPQNQHYICRLHNLVPRLETLLKEGGEQNG